MMSFLEIWKIPEIQKKIPTINWQNETTTGHLIFDILT